VKNFCGCEECKPHLAGNGLQALPFPLIRLHGRHDLVIQLRQLLLYGFRSSVFGKDNYGLSISYRLSLLHLKEKMVLQPFDMIAQALPKESMPIIHLALQGQLRMGLDVWSR